MAPHRGLHGPGVFYMSHDGWKQSPSHPSYKTRPGTTTRRERGIHRTVLSRRYRCFLDLRCRWTHRRPGESEGRCSRAHSTGRFHTSPEDYALRSRAGERSWSLRSSGSLYLIVAFRCPSELCTPGGQGPTAHSRLMETGVTSLRRHFSTGRGSRPRHLFASPQWLAPGAVRIWPETFTGSPHDCKLVFGSPMADIFRS